MNIAKMFKTLPNVKDIEENVKILPNFWEYQYAKPVIRQYCLP